MSRDKIERLIEFAPEHISAGVSILAYFSEYLKNKYPDLDVSVFISQDIDKLKMEIECPDGAKDIVEKTLDEYASVIVGKKDIDSVLSDEMHKLELNHKLEVAQVELAQTKTLIDLQQKNSKVNSSEQVEYQQKIAELSRAINQLESELESQKKHGEEIESHKQQLKEKNEALLVAKEELDSLKLGRGVDGAIESLSKSITDTDKAITRNVFGSNLFTSLSILFYSASLTLVFRLLYVDLAVVGNSSSMYLYIFPAVATFLIGTALLKHDGKLRQHYLSVSRQKHTLEKAAGLLEASRHLSEVKDLNPLVEETFSILRNNLLKGDSEGVQINEKDNDMSKVYEKIILSVIKDNKFK